MTISTIVDYATDVASTLAGMPASLVQQPGLKALLDRGAQLQLVAADLQAATSGGQAAPPALLAQWKSALGDWRTAQESLRSELPRYLVGRLPAVPGLDRLVSSVDWHSLEGLRGSVSAGPLSLQLSGQSLLVQPDPKGIVEAVGPLRPDTLLASLTGPMKGGGALRVLEDGVSGVLHLGLGAVDVSAIASLRKLPASNDASFLAILGLSFTPGIQVGFGFSLNRVGGLVGINRRVDLPALTRHVRSGTAADVLFASDPVKDAPRLLPAAEQMYAPAPGRHVFGPTFQLGWLKISTGSFFSLDLAIAIELPGPSKIILVGSARAEIPPVPLLRLRLDLVGWIDFAQKEIGFDASLVNSGILGVFTMAGDAAFRLNNGPRPYSLLSVGGFFPGFNPEPALLPPMRRVSLAIDSPLPGLSIRAEAYFAVTSNTLQFGGRIDCVFDAAAIEASGFLAVDVLIQYSPFHFHAQCSAGFRVKVFGQTLAGVRLDGTLDGPGPLVISGRLTIETFLFDISWHETFTIGGGGGDTRVPERSLVQALQGELAEPSNLRGAGAADGLVIVEPRPRQGNLALVSPVGQLEWSQRRAPLGIPIDRLEGVPLGSVQSVVATSSSSRGTVRELFSPGSFITLSTAEALNRPAFEQLDAGLRLGWDLEAGPAESSDARFKVIRRVYGEEPQLRPCPANFAVFAPGTVLGMIAERTTPASVTSTEAALGVVDEPWSTADGSTHTSATAAHQHVRASGGRLALPSLDMGQPLSLAGV